MGLVPLQKSQELLLPPSTCDPGGGFSLDTKSAGILTWDLPASRTERNKCLLLQPPSLWHSVRAPQSKTLILYGFIFENNGYLLFYNKNINERRFFLQRRPFLSIPTQTRSSLQYVLSWAGVVVKRPLVSYDACP